MGSNLAKETVDRSHPRLTSSQTRRDDGLLSPGTSVRGSEKADGEEEEDDDCRFFRQQDGREDESVFVGDVEEQEKEVGFEPEGEPLEGEGTLGIEEQGDEGVVVDDDDDDESDSEDNQEEEEQENADQLFIDMMRPSTYPSTSTPPPPQVQHQRHQTQSQSQLGPLYTPQAPLQPQRTDHASKPRQPQPLSSPALPLPPPSSTAPAQVHDSMLPLISSPLTPFRPSHTPSRLLRTYSRKNRLPSSSMGAAHSGLRASQVQAQAKYVSESFAIATPASASPPPPPPPAQQSAVLPPPPPPPPPLNYPSPAIATMAVADPISISFSKPAPTPRAGHSSPESRRATTPSTMKKQTSTPKRPRAKQTPTPSSAKITRQTVPVTIHVLAAEDGFTLPHYKILPSAEDASSSSLSSSSDASDSNNNNSHNSNKIPIVRPHPKHTFTLNLHPTTPIHHIAGHAAQYMICTLKLPINDNGFEIRNKEGIAMWDEETIVEAFQLPEVQVEAEADVRLERSAEGVLRSRRGVEIDTDNKPMVYLVERSEVQGQGKEKIERLGRLSIELEEAERRRSRSRGRDSVCRTPSVSSSRRGSRAPSLSAAATAATPTIKTPASATSTKGKGRKKKEATKTPRKTPSQRALEIAENWRMYLPGATPKEAGHATRSGSQDVRISAVSLQTIAMAKEEPLLPSIEHELTQGGDVAGVEEAGAIQNAKSSAKQPAIEMNGESTAAVTPLAAPGGQSTSSKSRSPLLSTKKPSADAKSATPKPKPKRSLLAPSNSMPRRTPVWQAKDQRQSPPRTVTPSTIIGDSTTNATNAAAQQTQPPFTQQRQYKADPYDIEAALLEHESSPRRSIFMSSAVRRLGSHLNKRSSPASSPKTGSQSKPPTSDSPPRSVRQSPMPQPVFRHHPPSTTETTESQNKTVISSTPNARTPIQISRQPSVTSIASLLPSSPTDHVAAALAKGHTRRPRKTMSKPIIIEDSEAEDADDKIDNVLREARDRFSMPSQSQTLPQASLAEVSLPWSAPPLRVSKEEDPFWPVRIVGRRRSDVVVIPSPVSRTPAIQAEKNDLPRWEQVDKSNVFCNLIGGVALPAASLPTTNSKSALPPSQSLPPREAEMIEIDDNSSSDDSWSVEDRSIQVEPSMHAPQHSVSLGGSFHDRVTSPTMHPSRAEATPRKSFRDVTEVPESPDIDTGLILHDELPLDPLPPSSFLIESNERLMEAPRPEVEAPLSPPPPVTIQYLPKSDSPMHESDIRTPPSAQASKRRYLFDNDSSTSQERDHPRKKPKSEDVSSETQRQDETRRLKKERRANKKTRRELEKARQEEERKRFALEEAHRKAKDLERVVSSPLKATGLYCSFSDESELEDDGFINQESSTLKRRSTPRQLIKFENEDLVLEGGSEAPLLPTGSTMSENVPCELLDSQRANREFADQDLPAAPSCLMRAEAMEQESFSGQTEASVYQRRHFDEWAFLESTLGLGLHSPMETHNRIHFRIMHAGLQDMMGPVSTPALRAKVTHNVSKDKNSQFAALGLGLEKVAKPESGKVEVQDGGTQLSNISKSKAVYDKVPGTEKSSEQSSTPSSEHSKRERRKKKHKKNAPPSLPASKNDEAREQNQDHNGNTNCYLIPSLTPSPKDLTVQERKSSKRTIDPPPLRAIFANDEKSSPDTSLYSIRSAALSPKDSAVRRKKEQNKKRLDVSLSGAVANHGSQDEISQVDGQDADTSLHSVQSPAAPPKMQGAQRLSSAKRRSLHATRKQRARKTAGSKTYQKLWSELRKQSKKKSKERTSQGAADQTRG
ncbi:hypothetical protein BD289DRAFT_266874 [Coniella lustricola]|uniref:Uncharacterized protein n=1 Tax=Coniella lustricola TaxID=2025994 RepID=A0A2T3A762_9PEZI|nr:hypothetical protein BD289DRAFT_266874 [Coniella lustricola]